MNGKERLRSKVIRLLGWGWPKIWKHGNGSWTRVWKHVKETCYGWLMALHFQSLEKQRICVFLTECKVGGIPRGYPRKLKRFQEACKVFTRGQGEVASATPGSCDQRLNMGGERVSSRIPQKLPRREGESGPVAIVQL